MAVIDVPFEIGQAWWAPRVYPEKVTVPCPVCFGKLAVVVELGDGERIGVPCEACGKGFEGPRGTIQEWAHTAGADEFVIADVKSMHHGRWWLVSTTGVEAAFEDLRASEAEALAESARRCAEQHESNMRSRQYKRKATKDASWSIQYHRKCIEDLELQIAWHRGRLLLKKRSATARAGTLTTRA